LELNYSESATPLSLWVLPLEVMNLLIAMMGGSYERVEESAINEGLKKRAELIVDFEKSPIYRSELFYIKTSQDPTADFFPQWLHFFKPTDLDATDDDASQRGAYTFIGSAH
jgi:ABC-type nitrate/sulfonate/bicarbonate transport system substrate-binding protein